MTIYFYIEGAMRIVHPILKIQGGDHSLYGKLLKNYKEVDCEAELVKKFVFLHAYDVCCAKRFLPDIALKWLLNQNPNIFSC